MPQWKKKGWQTTNPCKREVYLLGFSEGKFSLCVCWGWSLSYVTSFKSLFKGLDFCAGLSTFFSPSSAADLCHWCHWRTSVSVTLQMWPSSRQPWQCQQKSRGFVNLPISDISRNLLRPDDRTVAAAFPSVMILYFSISGRIPYSKADSLTLLFLFISRLDW